MKQGAIVDSIEAIIELYRKDIDMTMIDESLKRTPEERIRAAEELGIFLDALRSGIDNARQGRP